MPAAQSPIPNPGKRSMFHALRELIFRGPCYVRFNRDEISVRDVSRNLDYRSAAVVGIDQDNRIVSAGEPVSADATKIDRPFSHPRVVIDNFAVAEKLLCFALSKISPFKWLNPSPILLIHPEIELAGGLSEVETKALMELGASAGSRKTFVYYGGRLADAEVMVRAKV